MIGACVRSTPGHFANRKGIQTVLVNALQYHAGCPGAILVASLKRAAAQTGWRAGHIVPDHPCPGWLGQAAESRGAFLHANTSLGQQRYRSDFSSPAANKAVNEVLIARQARSAVSGNFSARRPSAAACSILAMTAENRPSRRARFPRTVAAWEKNRPFAILSAVCAAG
jgi:hypothetical protein